MQKIRDFVQERITPLISHLEAAPERSLLKRIVGGRSQISQRSRAMLAQYVHILQV